MARKTPLQLVEEMAVLAKYPTEVTQDDDGSGYVILTVTTPHGEIDLTVQAAFREAPQGMDPETGRSPADDWLNG